MICSITQSEQTEWYALQC